MLETGFDFSSSGPPLLRQGQTTVPKTKIQENFYNINKIDKPCFSCFFGSTYPAKFGSFGGQNTKPKRCMNIRINQGCHSREGGNPDRNPGFRSLPRT